MSPSWLRIAYVAVFLLAIVAGFTLWSEVGGQGHLDLMPWYWKLGVTIGLAWATVRATVSAVERENAWNIRTVAWTLGALTLLGMMAALTYYYHIHEGTDETAPDDSSVTAALFEPGKLL